MQLEKIISPQRTLCNIKVRSKKHCLEILSELMIQIYPQFTTDQIFKCLNKRERLGCTGLDSGVAFPHCRISNLDANSAALITLSEPIDFDAADGEPVDLIFGMLFPEELNESHYADIKIITQILSSEKLRSSLRKANSNIGLYKALLQSSEFHSQ
jgi:PTS system nitrogen regulatory IIA component